MEFEGLKPRSESPLSTGLWIGRAHVAIPLHNGWYDVKAKAQLPNHPSEDPIEVRERHRRAHRTQPSRPGTLRGHDPQLSQPPGSPAHRLDLKSEKRTGEQLPTRLTSDPRLRG